MLYGKHILFNLNNSTFLNCKIEKFHLDLNSSFEWRCQKREPRENQESVKGQPGECGRTASSLLLSAGLVLQKRINNTRKHLLFWWLTISFIIRLSKSKTQFFHFHSLFPDTRTFPLLFINMICYGIIDLIVLQTYYCDYHFFLILSVSILVNGKIEKWEIRMKRDKKNHSMKRENHLLNSKEKRFGIFTIFAKLRWQWRLRGWGKRQKEVKMKNTNRTTNCKEK